MQRSAPAFIQIEGLSKQFTSKQGVTQALEPVDLTVTKGEFVSVIGPSGCGKSTLMMLLAGLIKPSSGSVSIDGVQVRKPATNLGIVFQQDALLEWRTALQNIVLQAQIRGMEPKAAREEAMRLLEMMGLDKFADAYPRALSGGMRQRVSICRALLHRPPLLVMDEPFGALDALTRDQLQIDLQRLSADRGMTIVFITHSIVEAVYLSDRILVMAPRPGRVEAIIPVGLARPRRLAIRETPAFLGLVQQVTDIFQSLGVLRE